MNNTVLFEAFENGVLRVPNMTKPFADIPWTDHPAYGGVQLKHLITSKDTDGKFSYHLIRIAPNMSINGHMHQTQLETHEVISGTGVCVNNGQELAYETGVMTIFQPQTLHSVTAGDDGLQIFAKFMPPLV
ncbi:cupin [Oscillospiraceae bacterium CM]|nr:cupin [Oscillospiraceae bacterium CM]